MAVPKRRHTSARRDKKRANWKVSAPATTECPQCSEMKLSHRVCNKCGYYDKKQVIEVAE